MKEENFKDSGDSDDSDELIRRLQKLQTSGKVDGALTGSTKMKSRNGKSRSAGCQKGNPPSSFSSPSRRKPVTRTLDRPYASYAESYSRTTSATSHTSTSTGSVLLSPEKRLFSGSTSSVGTSTGRTLLPPLQMLTVEGQDLLPGSVEEEWPTSRLASPCFPVPSLERRHEEAIAECEVEVQRVKCKCFRSLLLTTSCGTQTDPQPPATLRNPWFGKEGDRDVAELKATDSESSVQNREDKSEITQIRRLEPSEDNGCFSMFRKCCSKS